MRRLSAWLCAACLLSAGASAQADWLKDERAAAITKLRANISPAGSVPGTVIASPQREGPNYYFHWVRDAALVMQSVMELLKTSLPGFERATYEGMMRDYVALSRRQQEAHALTGLGEPKFEVDGSPYMGDWGRPQNDGPALRAISLIQYAFWKLDQGEDVRDLYDSKLPTGSPIKTDLEYVARVWREPSFDLWEEVLGDHFYTRMVQRRALVEGARLARALGDPWAADWYERQARELSVAIEAHWDGPRGRIKPTLNRRGGADYKHSDLDVAVVLGVLHGYADDGFFSYSDPRVQSTAVKLIDAFKQLYPVNSNGPGVAIGRYPEDIYSGGDFGGGNPWVLATLAMAELSYRQAAELREPTLKAYGDQFADRVQQHAFRDGSLSEQINRVSGYMTSARDLTWNYAAVLTALKARDALF